MPGQASSLRPGRCPGGIWVECLLSLRPLPPLPPGRWQQYVQYVGRLTLPATESSPSPTPALSLVQQSV
eukprot:3936805-Rhodomonas_salina.1